MNENEWKIKMKNRTKIRQWKMRRQLINEWKWLKIWKWNIEGKRE